MKILWRIVCGVSTFYVFSAIALWYAYSMAAYVEGGMYTRPQALRLTEEMAFVSTGLVIFAVLIAWIIYRESSLIRMTVQNGLATGFVLVGYTVANFLWRNSWDPSTNRAAFMPPWSELNSRFFYEYNGLSYLLFFMPLEVLMTCALSAVFVWSMRREETVAL